VYRLVFVLVLLGLSAGPAAADEIVAPDWSLAASDETVLRLSEAVADGPVVLFFWASWCPFCKALMPHLQSIRIEYDGVVDTLALNVRDDGEPVEYVRQRGYDFVVLPNADAVAEQYGVYGTPGILIVDRDQVVRFDLRDLPRPEIPAAIEQKGVSSIASYVAPYWAAGIRRRLDAALADDDGFPDRAPDRRPAAEPSAD